MLTSRLILFAAAGALAAAAPVSAQDKKDEAIIPGASAFPEAA
jgi:hypothetical protein